MTSALLCLLSLLGAQPQPHPVVLDVPKELRGAPIEVSVVCPDARGGWRGAGQWQALTGTPRSVVAGQECRVLLRADGAPHYFASEAVALRHSRGSLLFSPHRLRDVLALPARSQPYWLGSSAAGVDCWQSIDGSRCMFVPHADAGVMVAVDPSGLAFVLAGAKASAAAPWRSAPWGRLVRVGGSGHDQVSARVTVLEPSLKRGRDLLREPRVSTDARVHRLGPSTFWIEGRSPESDGRLEISAPRAATALLPLDHVRGSPLSPLDIALAPEDWIEGDVRSDGRLLPGATVALFRLLEPIRDARPERNDETGKDDERAIERVGERVTDEAGWFRFGGLARGEYELLVSHPRRGRARRVLTAPAIARIAVAPHAVVRGRVVRHGVPVAGALVTVLPSHDVVIAARNPASLFSESAKTALDGRFELIPPEEGRLTLTVLRDGSSARIALGHAAALPPVLDVGDIRLEEPLEIAVLLDVAQTCVVSAAGPMGQSGVMLRTLRPAGAGRWLLQSALEGRWFVEAVCEGRSLPLENPLIEVSRSSRDPVRMAVRR